MNADLHCHSKVSDGSIAIEDLVWLAKRAGLGAIAIADHDTVEGFSCAERAGKESGVTVISAIEISAYDYKRNRKAHILGYLMDRPGDVGDACRSMLMERQETSKWIVNTLIAEGYPITWEFVSKTATGSTNVYKQHIMHALMDLGYATSIRDEVYKKLFRKPKDGSPGGIAYREITYMDALTAVNIVKKAGGITVLAHPAGYNNMELIPELVSVGLDGLEAWPPSHSEESVSEIISEAQKYNLIVTGGSDFHGMYEGRANPLGSCYTPETWLEKLYDRKARTDSELK